MPVISPRRSSTSSSGSLFRTTTGTGSSSTTSSTKPSAYSSYHSFLNSYSPSSYTPNASNFRHSYTSPISSLGTYRSTASSHLDSSINSANDTYTSSRYGLTKKPPIGDTQRRGIEETDRLRKKPPTGENNNSSKRLSGSSSSSSLAHMLATSTLDIYEKYSPAYYTPNTELTRSSSRSSLVDTNELNNNQNNNNNNNNNNTNNDKNNYLTDVTLERPRSRYSRLYSSESSNDVNNKKDVDTVDCSNGSTSRAGSIRRSYGKLSQSNSNSDVPTATFTLRNSRSYNIKPAGSETEAGSLKNGFNGSTNSLDAQLKELKLSNSSNDLSKVNNNTDDKHVVATTNGNGEDVEVSVTLKLNGNKSKVNTKRKTSNFALTILYIAAC